MNHAISSEAKLVSGSQFFIATMLVVVVAILSCGRAQAQSTQNTRGAKNSVESRRLSEASELANENYEHLDAARLRPERTCPSAGPSGRTGRRGNRCGNQETSGQHRGGGQLRTAGLR